MSSQSGFQCLQRGGQSFLPLYWNQPSLRHIITSEERVLRKKKMKLERKQSQQNKKENNIKVTQVKRKKCNTLFLNIHENGQQYHQSRTRKQTRRRERRFWIPLETDLIIQNPYYREKHSHILIQQHKSELEQTS